MKMTNFAVLDEIYGVDVVELALETLDRNIRRYPESYFEEGSDFVPHYWVVAAMCTMFVRGMENR